jgi:small-conductance mechanosensitive channel
MENINYNRLSNTILTNLENTFTSASFYWQSVSIVACFVVAIIFYKLVKKFCFSVKSQSDNKEVNFINKYFSPLFLPILMMLFLAIGAAIFSSFFKESFLFYTTMQLIALFIFLRFIRILFASNLVANLVGFFLIPAIILNIFGLFEPAITFLDQFSVDLGKVRISVYTVIKAFVILLVVFWGSGVISKKAKSYFSNKRDIKPSTKGIITKIIDITVYFAVFVVILKVFGVDMTTFAVIGGAVGVGIGFGLQKIASNFISGIILLLEKSVEVGDLVELDGVSVMGTVTHFGGRYTLIETFDGKEIMVPNEDFITNRVNNWTYNNSRGRIEIELGVAYDSDLQKVQEIMMTTAKEHPRCLDYPTAEWYIDKFGDFSISVMIHFWIADVNEGRLKPKSDVMMVIFERFKESGIVIPMPQRDINIKTQ